MLGERSKGKRRRKRNKFSFSINPSQEKASYFFFIGLLIIAIFGCVASGAPTQGFYGIIFVSIGILCALFPPLIITSKLLNIGLILFLISLSSSLLPRDFASSQNWRMELENIGLETGNHITPHPAVTVEFLILFGSIALILICSCGHRLNRLNFFKLAKLFVILVGCYCGVSMIFKQNGLKWTWDPNQSFGFFANQNHMATLMVMGSLVGTGVLFVSFKKNNLITLFQMLISLGVICWAIMGYSSSRAGLSLFILFQIVFFVFIGKENRNYKIAIPYLALFILSFLLFLISDNKLESRFKNLTQKSFNVFSPSNYDIKDEHNSILGLRNVIHADTFKMIKSEPWTGTGLGTFEFIFPFYQKKSSSFSVIVERSKVLHPESHWLDLASQAGILSTILALVIILLLLFLMIVSNKKSGSWVLCLSCSLSVFCILLHGLVDVPGQKIGIIFCGIFLLGITQKFNPKKDRFSHLYLKFIYQILAVSIFIFGFFLIYSQWFTSESILFSDGESRKEKIQNLYQLSITSAKSKDSQNQKKFLLSAINLTEKALKRTPLDSQLHFTRGKLYSLLEGNENEIKSSFRIESALDRSWEKIPLRQADVWLFINIRETKKLWSEALVRSEKLGDRFSRSTWFEVLEQAQNNPLLIRDVYEIIMSKDDPYYIRQWMNVAGNKNLDTHMGKILKSNILSDETKKNIQLHWKKISPDGYKKYF